MPKTVGVAVSNATFHFDKLYTYAVMPDQQETVRLGSMVLVPFGRSSKARMGVVLACDEEPEHAKLKYLFDVAPASACLTPELLRLVHFLKERTFCTYYEAVKAVIPYGAQYKPAVAADGVTPVLQKQLTRHTENSYKLVGTLPQKPKPTAKQLAAVALLSGGERTQNEMEDKGISKAVLDNLCAKGVLECSKINKSIDLYSSIPLKNEPITLTTEQQAAYDALLPNLEDALPHSALLYGVTGSGKTQVYISLIHSVLAEGRTALVLVPEIALTPQLLAQFSAQFGDEIAILHSMLSAGERYDEWKRVRSSQAKVVVGTRSAVFAPLKDLGLIVLDEEQESSYKSENTPRYHARDVAKYRAARSGALLVLGSATPSVESMYHARAGDYHLFTMRQRFNQHALPRVIIADMKQALRSGSDEVIGPELLEELKQNIDRGEQSILFINRRGTSRMAVCTECGESPQCPRCTVRLTYHKANGRLMCHYCGHSEPLPAYCPSCGGTLAFSGAGTQKVQEEVQRLFPGIEVMRMDTDTISATHSHEKMLDKFHRQNIPILVGTQMVAKGLDFENVTLVGVISADQSLYVDDYRAAERTFSLLTQVVGRAGRGERLGRAVIQTFTPQNDVIQCAAEQDYDRFYANEIRMREARGMPPYRDLYVFTVSGTDEGAVLRSCMRLADGLRAWQKEPALRNAELQILGPAAAPVLMVNKRYRYRITVLGRSCPALRKMVGFLLRSAHADQLNRGVSVYADLNPLD